MYVYDNDQNPKLKTSQQKSHSPQTWVTPTSLLNGITSFFTWSAKQIICQAWSNANCITDPWEVCKSKWFVSVQKTLLVTVSHKIWCLIFSVGGARHKVTYQRKALSRRVARLRDLVGLDFQLEGHHGGQINHMQSEKWEQHLWWCWMARDASPCRKSPRSSPSGSRGRPLPTLIRRACSRQPGRNNADNFRATGGVSICKGVSALCSGHQRCSKRNSELLAICHIR